MITIVHPIYMEKYLNQDIVDYFTTTGFVGLFVLGGDGQGLTVLARLVLELTYPHDFSDSAKAAEELGVWVGEVYIHILIYI